MNITFVVPIKGRLWYLKQALPSMLKLAPVMLVDYDCPDKSLEWAFKEVCSYEGCHQLYGRVEENKPVFNLSKARNLGARTVDTEWIGFVDCDMLLSPDLITTIESKIQPNCYFTFTKVTVGLAGFIVCKTEDYKFAGGYDEDAEGYGFEDTQFRYKLGYMKKIQVLLPDTLASHIDHSTESRTTFYKDKNTGSSWETNRMKLEKNIETWKKEKGIQ